MNNMYKDHDASMTKDRRDLTRLIDKAEGISESQREMTMSFPEAVKKYMTSKHKKRDDLAEETGLSVETISRMRNKEDYCPTKQMVIAVCVALDLTPAEAWSLFSRSGNQLRMTIAQDVAYYQILCECGRFTIEEINEELARHKYKPLGE